MIQEKLLFFQNALAGSKARLIAVSKTHPVETLRLAYEAGCRVFGENKVQELVPKYEALPKDIEWHLIGSLQSNKVKYIAPFVKLIHSVDSYKLLEVIDKEAQKNNRVIDCLLQIYIAQEETKHGLAYQEAEEILISPTLPTLQNIRIVGFMGMATFTEDEAQIRQEFHNLAQFSKNMQAKITLPNVHLTEISMGMSNDYTIAVEEGSTLIRVGSAIFGAR
jgi:pyridoxal phosphate enzyme (YggS family)